MTVTDVLLTTFSLRGADTLIQATNLSADAFTKLAAAEGVVHAATATLGGGLTALAGSPLALVGLAVGAATLAMKVHGEALKAFGDSEDSIARVAIQMRNLGNVFPIDQLNDFAGGLTRLTGIDDELITSLGVAAAQFGLTRKQIEADLPKILDIAVANKMDPNEVFTKFKQAAGGRLQGLRAFNINPDLIKGDLRDIDSLINQVGKSFEGTAAAFRNTLPGTVNAFHTAVGNLAEAIGRLLSPTWVPLLNLFIGAIERATALLQAIADFFHLPTAADLGKGRAGSTAGAMALKGDPEHTELLGQIAGSTASTSQFISEVLGGSGEVARSAFSTREARMAFGI